LKTVNRVIWRIPNDEVEIIVAEPSSIMITANRFSGGSIEHNKSRLMKRAQRNRRKHAHFHLHIDEVSLQRWLAERLNYTLLVNPILFSRSANEKEISHGRVPWQTRWTYFGMGPLASSIG